MPRYEHMTWCDGTHDDEGACLLERGNADHRSDEPGCALVGAPCNSAHLSVRDAAIVGMEQCNQLVGWLHELTALLLASAAETDCDQHYHNFDRDYNDHAEGCPARGRDARGAARSGTATSAITRQRCNAQGSVYRDRRGI